jgi:hypothetical protein
MDRTEKEEWRHGLKVLTPSYRVVDLGNRDLCFEFSPATQEATDAFYKIQANYAESEYAAVLRKFVRKHPNHIDGLCHYANSLFSERKFVNAFTFSQAAVGIGRTAIPSRFKIGRDRIRTSFIQNRPFLRGLHGLMRTQYTMRLDAEAVNSAETALKLDPEDRYGFRDWLVIFYLDHGCDEHTCPYLKVMITKALFLGSSIFTGSR